MTISIEETRKKLNLPSEKFSDEDVQKIINEWRRVANLILDIVEKKMEEKRN